jgi:hypothetical protein
VGIGPDHRASTTEGRYMREKVDICAQNVETVVRPVFVVGLHAANEGTTQVWINERKKAKHSQKQFKW